MADQPDNAGVRKKERAEDDHERERAVLFANETFFLGMLQAVSGASLFAALSQWQALADHGGRLLPLAFLTLMGLALISAVLGAYWKHQYKMWGVKSGHHKLSGESAVGDEYIRRARRYLSAMRFAMLFSVLTIVFALAWLIVVAWSRVLCTYPQ